MECSTTYRREEYGDGRTSMSPIPLQRMPQQLSLRSPQDDWTGLSSPTDRRKLQNRLNQRASRKRKVTVSKATCSNTESCTLADGAMPLAYTELAIPKIEQIDSLCKLDSTEIQRIINSFERWASWNRNLPLTSPRSDHLLTLVKFNVFRALVENYAILGLSVEQGMKDDAISPFFCTMNPPRPYPSLPLSLRPTMLQRQISHHPWIDTLPEPEMRDNILRAGDWFDSVEMEFCSDLVGFFSAATGRSGVVVWGESWDPSGWELTSTFVKHWGWVVMGCKQMLESTNNWRSQRGEGPLGFDDAMPEQVDRGEEEPGLNSR